MYPTKSANDYTMEINRLFQTPSENDGFERHTNSPLSPFNFSTVNRSSSSAESISPDSFPDITSRVFDEPSVFSHQNYMRTESNAIHKDNRRRAIIGRRIMTDATTPVLKKDEPNYFNWDVDVSIWQPSEALPKPIDKKIITENEHHSNLYYKLFPETKSPERMATASFNTTNVMHSRMSNSPSPLNMTSKSEPFQPKYLQQSQNMTSAALINPMLGPSTSKQSDMTKLCTFCRKNGETALVYMTHMVKQKIGNKYIVTCPILRSHVCSECGLSGDQAHTITYCPLLQNSNNGQPLMSTTVTLKNTRVKSNGRRRY